MKNKKSIFFLLSLLFLVSSIQAQEKPQSFVDLSLEELLKVKVFIASGTEEPISEAPATVTVITSQDIKNTGSTNLTDILESVPGIHINTNVFAGRPLVHMRGTNSFQVLLMIDGNPVRDLVWAFGIFWKGLPVSSIERIEIIRGPGSALYGADAEAGVINVITKVASGIKEDEAGLRLGSFNTQTAWLKTGGKVNDFEMGLTADFSTTDGYNPFILADGHSARNSAISTAPANANYAWDNSDLRFSIAKDNWRLLSSYVRRDNLKIGLTGGGNLDPLTNANDERYDIDLLYNNQNLTQNWGLDTKFHYQDLNYSSNNGFQESPPTVDYPDGALNQMSSSERQYKLEANAKYKGFKDQTIRFGTGYNWMDLYRVEQKINKGIGPDGKPLPPGGPLVDISGTKYAFAPEKIRKLIFLFVQDEWEFANNWELTMGARYDRYSDFGSTFNPRVALIWQTSNKLSTKLMYGQAFRAPSYQELYAETSRSLGNSELKPERSETIELAFAYALSKAIQLDFSVYNLKIADSISRVRAVGESTPQYQNTGTNKISGIEVEASWQLMKQLALSGNYSYRNLGSDNFRLTSAPKQQAYLRSDWAFLPQWNWNLQLNWISGRSRALSDTRPAINDYTLVDTSWRFSGIKDWEFAASIRNLFNEDAREPSGRSIPNDLPLAQRNMYAEIRYKF